MPKKKIPPGGTSKEGDKYLRYMASFFRNHGRFPKQAETAKHFGKADHTGARRVMQTLERHGHASPAQRLTSFPGGLTDKGIERLRELGETISAADLARMRELRAAYADLAAAASVVETLLAPPRKLKRTRRA